MVYSVIIWFGREVYAKIFISENVNERLNSLNDLYAARMNKYLKNGVSGFDDRMEVEALSASSRFVI